MSAIMDSDTDRAKSVAAECGGTRVFSDSQSLIGDVDAVLIASPNSTHVPLTIDCLKAGKPVLCEKPLGDNAGDAWRIIDEEISCGQRLVQVGFMREYDPPHRHLKTLLESGKIGKPLLFRGYHYNPFIGFERQIDDVISGSAVHDIHSARWLFGREIYEVFVKSIPFSEERKETSRLLVIHATFQGGALGIIQINTASNYGYEVSVEITGQSGTIATEYASHPWVRYEGTVGRRVESDWLERFQAAYVSEAQAWIEGISTGNICGPSSWDGYVSLLVADACKESARAGTPVNVRQVDRPSFYASSSD